MAVPVTNSAADFLFKNISAAVTGASAANPSNDIEANVVLVAPTTSGLSAGLFQVSQMEHLSRLARPFFPTTSCRSTWLQPATLPRVGVTVQIAAV
jgi:hypothetical protein